MGISNRVEAPLKDLAKKIITRGDLIFYIEEINLAEKLLFKDIKIPLSERVKGEAGEEFRNLLKDLEKKGLIFGSPVQQFSFFEEIKKELKAIPQVKLEIAFEASKDFLLTIKNRLREITLQEIILDVTRNPKLVAGAIIEYQGKYLDFSLAKKIDELILQKTL